MVGVSDNFKELAQQNGRHVYCKILAGNETFLDDRIIEFDFNDVIHPDCYAIGTVCSNRFSFTVRFTGSLELRDVVRPFVSFDNAEWCPLGIFYVTKRYVRGNYASIICYDKMYDLDIEYKPSAAITDTRALLEDVCAQAGLSCSYFGLKCKISKIPTDCTVRDIISFVSSMNGACAKINRSGALELKAYSQMSAFYIYEKSCIGFSRNMSPSVLSRVVAETDEGIIESGDGGELSTLELYNPFMTQLRANQLVTQFKPFSFYGADIEMQGFPFLESGDYIWLREASGVRYPLVISELELSYDGALTAVLHSKNRSYTDTVIHRGELEKALGELRASAECISLAKTNNSALEVSGSEVAAAEFSFETRTFGAEVRLNASLPLTADIGTVVSITMYVNGTQTGAALQHKLAGGAEIVHILRAADNLPKGGNRVSVTLRASGGTAKIAAGQLCAVLEGKGISF